MSDPSTVKLPPPSGEVSEIEERPGVVSSIRVTLRWARRLGACMVVAGIALAGVMLALDRPAFVPISVALITLGAGLPGAVAGAKSYQSKYEGG